MKTRRLAAVLPALLAGLVCGAFFAPAATAQIVVGQTADLSGPAAASVAELNAGARLLIERFDRAQPDLASAAARLAAAQAQAVLVIGSGAAVARATQSLRAAGSRAQVVTLSNNASHGFIRLLGPHARGVVVTQVFPSQRALDLGAVQQAVTLAREAGLADLSPAMMEGFVSAKLLLEALRRAGPKPDRARIAAALGSLGRWDLGGLVLDYGRGSREGVRYVELSIIGADGRFMR